MEYQHCDRDEKHLSLHDCRADKVFFENGELIFYFTDGFWIGPTHEENPLKKTVRTDAAEVRFHLSREKKEDALIYLFTHKKPGIDLREIRDLAPWMADINQKDCQLEFIYQYTDVNSRILKCELWSKKKPYHRECELILYTDRVSYLWNRLREDYTW